eukprot:1487313-Rhodomonas_salina.2
MCARNAVQVVCHWHREVDCGARAMCGGPGALAGEHPREHEGALHSAPQADRDPPLPAAQQHRRVSSSHGSLPPRSRCARGIGV